MDLVGGRDTQCDRMMVVKYEWGGELRPWWGVGTHGYYYGEA